jgi:N-acetylglucosamine-6-phosphate deacetylase
MTESTGKSLWLSNARIVLPERVIGRGSLLLEAGQIASISETTPRVAKGETEVDLGDLTVLPGFIDVHNHGALGFDVNTAGANDLHEMAKFLAHSGVTAWLPTLVPDSYENYRQAMSAIEELMGTQNNREPAAKVIGVHYEGPFVNTAQCGALRSSFFKRYSRPSDLDSLPAPRVDEAVRMITLAPELEGGINLVTELNRRRWVVSIGHTRAETECLDQAFAAGARHMTHFMNAMPPLHHRSPGPVGWGLSREDVTCDVIADGIHLDPIVLRLLLKIKGADRLSLISDAIAAAGKGDGEYQIWGETIIVKQGRTSNSRGSIAGSVITMLDAVRMMLSVGASEVDAARMASTNPARLLGLDHECGSIEEGKRADLVVLDKQGNVRRTIVGGTLLNHRSWSGTTYPPRGRPTKR